MANRHTLSVDSIDHFKKWLISDGWQTQEPKGYYEVLRATKEGKKHPLVVYKRHDTNGGKELVHFTVADRDMGVVRAFLKTKREDDDSYLKDLRTMTPEERERHYLGKWVKGENHGTM